jgi:hypothetical protein
VAAVLVLGMRRPRVTDTAETTATVPDGLTLTANWYATKAHYAPVDSMNPTRSSHPGQFGLSLCGREVYSQGFQDSFGRPKRRVLANLPLCKLCVRQAAKREVSG